jgi:flagellin-like hook-associated protein FlgL
MIRTAVVTAVRQALKEPVTSAWTDDELGTILDNVLREMANEEPLLKRANLAIIQYTKDIDVSPLTMRDIIRVEYPVGNDPYEPIYRRFTTFGSTIMLDLEEIPDITSGTLTGTVTFTINSRSVTGSGTAFASELSDGDLICKSSGTKYYCIAKVVSNTALTLDQPFEESTAADTINLTKYRDYLSCARIIYGGDYTVSSTSDLPTSHDATMILGVVAHAATEYAANYAQLKMTDITSKLASAATAIGNVSARITQAISDLSTGRTNLGADLTSYSNTLADVETALDAIGTHITSAITYVNQPNPGEDVAGHYVEMARTRVQEGAGRLDKARSYLDSAKTNSDYLQLAVQELSGGATYTNQAQAYIAHAEQAINVNNLVRAYQSWADKKWQQYQVALGKMGRIADGITYRSSRG